MDTNGQQDPLVMDCGQPTHEYLFNHFTQFYANKKKLV